MNRRAALVVLAFAAALLAPVVATTQASALPSGPHARHTARQSTAFSAPIHCIARVSPRLGGLPGGASATAANWAGYDVTGGGFHSVIATWTQPAAPANLRTDTLAFFWVGLDGDVSTTVEQIGTGASTTRNGSVSYYAWYEMFPAVAVPIDSLTIAPGDALTASVVSNGSGVFTLTIDDATTGHSYTTTQPNGPTSPFSAEVIAEAPTDALSGKQDTLAGFDTVAFSSCAFNGLPISSFACNQLDMVSGTTTLASASALGSDGASFSVSTGLTLPQTTVSGADGLWHNTPVSLTFTPVAGSSPLGYTEYSLTGGTTWIPGGSLTITAPSTHANDGMHTVLYRSVDALGFAEAAKSCQVGIDTQPPKTTLIPANPQALGHWSTKPVSFTYTASDAGGSGVAATQIKLDNGAWTTWSPGTTYTVPAAADHSTDGRHGLLLYSTDTAGNQEAVQTFGFGIDTVAPTAQAPHAAKVQRGATARLDFKVLDAAPSMGYCHVVIRVKTLAGRLKQKLAPTRWYGCGPLHSLSFRCRLPRGKYKFTVTASDGAANVSLRPASNYLRVF